MLDEWDARGTLVCDDVLMPKQNMSLFKAQCKLSMLCKSFWINFKICGFSEATLLNWAPSSYLSGIRQKIVVENEHQKDMCHKTERTYVIIWRVRT